MVLKLHVGTKFRENGQNSRKSRNLIPLKYLYQNHHIIKGDRLLPAKKVPSKEIYSILISNIVNKSISNVCFEIV